jgi:hypothetical protein
MPGPSRRLKQRLQGSAEKDAAEGFQQIPALLSGSRQISTNPTKGLCSLQTPEAAGHLEFDLGHADVALALIVRCALTRRNHSAGKNPARQTVAPAGST